MNTTEQIQSAPVRPLREQTAEEIRALMARRRMTGMTLARRIGRSQSYVSRRLTGETAFDVDDLEGIASALGVTVNRLIPGVTEPYLVKPDSAPSKRDAAPAPVRPFRPRRDGRPAAPTGPTGPGRTSRVRPPGHPFER